MPFQYPSEPHERIHGPTGYASYKSYRGSLRDELLFRCVYCLKGERWGQLKTGFELDHFIPQSISPEAKLSYDNLLYACASCNSAKRALLLPNPLHCLLSESVQILEDGSVTAKNEEAALLIRLLGLGSPEYREYRQLMLNIIELARQYDPDLYRRLMGYPEDLPDLETLRPPGNTRPDGVAYSCFAMRSRDELPETY